MRYADELGVSRQMIYKLIGIVRAWDAARDSGAAPTRWRSDDEASARIINEAVTELGTGAIAERVFERAGRIAAARGLGPPSRQRVHTILNRTPAGAALSRRLDLPGGLILDAAALAVSMAGGGSDPRPAVLTVLWDLDLGRVAAWAVTDGPADEELLAGPVAEVRADGYRPLFATKAIARIDGIDGAVRPPGRLLPGTVVRGGLGSAIGRIRLLPQGVRARPGQVPRVAEEDLRTVLLEMIGPEPRSIPA